MKLQLISKSKSLIRILSQEKRTKSSQHTTKAFYLMMIFISFHIKSTKDKTSYKHFEIS
jgi:hypothetical protein